MVLVGIVLVLSAVPSPTSANDPTQPTKSAPRLDRPDTESSGEVAAAGDFSVPNFQEEIVFSGLIQPIVVDFAEDGRVFVGEKSGLIKVFDGLDDPTPSIWADVRTKVHDFWDRGMLGMALDPNFTSNGRLYVAYTHNAAIGGSAPRWSDGVCPSPPGATTDGCVVSGRLSALTADGNEQVLVEDWCQQFPSHSMSDIVFDLEGALLVNGGDGASFDSTDYGQYGGSLAGTPTPKNPCGDPPGGVGATLTLPSAEGGALRSQDVRTSGDPVGLSGTVIRVDRMTGLARTDNPTTAGSENAQRIIGYGLRNPFRMAVHPVSGELWIGDVGWSTWEEINRHPDPDGPVRNYGWPCIEGASTEPGVYHEAALCESMTGSIPPHLAYRRGTEVVDGDGCGGGGSITGMAFYEGGAYPGQYDNALFFNDYSRQCLWVMPAGAGGLPNAAAVSHFADLANPVHLTVGPGGDLFYVDIGGTIRRIRHLGDNLAPSAAIDADPISGALPLEVDFDASGSTDPDGNPLTYAWDFGEDGDELFNDAAGVAPSHTYTNAGTFTARVRVSDGQGASDVAEITINAANSAPTATIVQPASSLTWSVNQRITFSGTGTDPNQGSLPASAMTWELILAHCPDDCHEHPLGTFPDRKSGSFVAPDHEYPSHLILRLRVEDGDGASDTIERVLQPKTVNLQVRSNPSGLAVDAGWVEDTTPFNLRVIAGSAITLSAPSSVLIDGFPYKWTSWSNGRARNHTVNPTSAATYTATYRGGFADVPVGTKFRSDIAWLVRNEITVGCGTNLFCPNGLVTRGQMATFLTRALDLPATSRNYFTDDNSNKHEGSINRLAASGITVGCGRTTFCPNGVVTRAQMATFLTRAFDLPSTSRDFYTDDDANKHEGAINRLAAADVTRGCGATTYCPNGAVTRGQMAAFLHRASQR